MRKFNLSVPDALAAEIDEHREHLGSLSAIFQEAVRAKVQGRKDFLKRLKGDETMDAIIERLRREKAEAQNNYFEKGKQDGLRWAKAASYNDLEYARRFELVDDEGLYDPTIPLHDDQLGHYFIDTLEADTLTDPSDDEDELNPFARQWVKGWKEAVVEFWREVENKL